MAVKKKKTTKIARASRASQVQATARPQKPFFRPATLVAFLALLAVVAGVILANRKAEEEANATPTPGAEETFIFEDDKVVASIEVAPAEGDSVRVERNEENAWVLSKPEKAEADQGAAEAAASQVGALLVVLPIEKVEDPAVFGFDKPDYTITVEFEDGTKSVLEVGDRTPSEDGYYARVDAEKVYVVASSGIDALTSLLIFPPYLNTPTPSPTATFTPLPTETPVPATEAPSTPEATGTP